jgi:hypothetical protein
MDPFYKMFKAQPFTDGDIKKLEEGWVAFADDWLKLIQPIEFLRSPRNGEKPPKSLSIYVHLFRSHLGRLLEVWRNLARGNQQGVELMHKMVKQNAVRHTPHNLPRMDALEHECRTQERIWLSNIYDSDPDKIRKHPTIQLLGIDYVRTTVFESPKKNESVVYKRPVLATPILIDNQ